MTISVISFDGLNRSGKGTQLNFFSNYLKTEKHLFLILRGDGSRKGEGKLVDPKSEWWESIQQSLKIETEPEREFYWDMAAKKLNEELYESYNHFFPMTMKIFNYDKGYILLDRSIISRHFVKKRYQPKITIDDLCSPEIIKPNLSFILNVPKKVLLERNKVIADHPEKYDFRRKVIEDYFDSFEETIDDAKKSQLNVVELDGTKAPEKIFKEVKRWYQMMGV